MSAENDCTLGATRAGAMYLITGEGATYVFMVTGASAGAGVTCLMITGVSVAVAAWVAADTSSSV